MSTPGSNAVDIDLAATHASAGAISDVVEQMKTVLARIQGSAANGQKDWSGDASRAFGSTHGEWQDIATRLNDALREMEVNLSSSFKGYGNQDADLVGVIQQAAGGGGYLRI